MKIYRAPAAKSWNEIFINDRNRTFIADLFEKFDDFGQFFRLDPTIKKF